MWRILIVIASGLLISACGGGIGSYEEGMEAQSEIMLEMVSVLEDVDDASSAKKAAGKIESLGKRLAEISAQVAELPRPNAKEMQDLAKKQRAEMQAFQQNAAAQMMKLAEYPVLTDAWMRAMENMR
jgi:hypothetical protein